MHRYYSNCGCKNPNFVNKVEIDGTIGDMMVWCDAFENKGRYYVDFQYGATGYPHRSVFQFESEDAAFMFKLTFGK
jgi:RNase adaptor protein for sRNA GlmZ degradation